MSEAVGVDGGGGRVLRKEGKRGWEEEEDMEVNAKVDEGSCK